MELERAKSPRKKATLMTNTKNLFALVATSLVFTLSAEACNAKPALSHPTTNA